GWDTVGCRRCIAQISRDGAAILYLHRTNFARRALQRIKAAGKWCSYDLTPRCQPANADAVRCPRYAPQFAQPRNIYDRALHHTITERGIKIGASRKNPNVP